MVSLSAALLLGRSFEANTTDEDKLEEDKLSYDFKLQAAQTAYESGDILTAYPLYMELLQQAPEDERIYRNLASICMEEERYRNAQEILQIGIAATNSDVLIAMLQQANLQSDFGTENGQVIDNGIELAEQIAEITGDSEKIEIGKKLYALIRQLK